MNSSAPANSSNVAGCSPANTSFRYLVLTDPRRTDQEGLFPEGEISIVLGPSGAGKTTWLLKFIQSWSRGETLFSRPVCSKKFLFLSFDRSAASLERTAKRMNIDLKTFPHWTPEKLTESEEVPEKTLKRLLKLPEHRGVKVVFIEGLDMQVPGGKIADTGTVKRYMSSLQHFAKRHGLTIIGTVGSPKMKPGEKYLSPRERAIGSTYWGRMAETIVVIEPKAGNDKLDLRELQILSRQAPAEAYCFRWENGLLVEAPCSAGPDQKQSKHADRITEWLDNHKDVGERFTLEELANALDAKSNSLSYPLELSGPLGKKGWVEKVEYGVYIWNGRGGDVDQKEASNTSEVSSDAGYSVLPRSELLRS